MLVRSWPAWRQPRPSHWIQTGGVCHLSRCVAGWTVSGCAPRGKRRRYSSGCARPRAVADVRPVTDRDGRTKPFVMVDLAPAARRQIVELAISLPQEPQRGADLDLRRLDLAI